LEFAKDPNIGYTTSLVRNLGVIDVKVNFQPTYYKFYNKRLTPEVIAKRFNIECKQIPSESVTNPPLTLTNKIRFGMTGQ
jgi:hypothetical protein